MLLAPPGEIPALEVCAAENAAAVEAVVEALRVSAATLGGSDELPDLGRLQRTREALAQALVRDIVSARAGAARPTRS